VSHLVLPLSFDWTFLMSYSKAKFKSNFDKIPSLFQTIVNRKYTRWMCLSRLYCRFYLMTLTY